MTVWRVGCSVDRLVCEDAGGEEPRREALILMGQVGGGGGMVMS